MGWGSRQAPLFSVWWRTSNIWPWGSSLSHRNRGTHIKTPLHTAYLLFFSFWNVVLLKLSGVQNFLVRLIECVGLDSESQNQQNDLWLPSDWSLCIKLRGWPMAQQQGRASSSNSSRAQDRWTSAHRFSSTSSSLVRMNLKCTQYTFCGLWPTHIIPSYLLSAPFE